MDITQQLFINNVSNYLSDNSAIYRTTLVYNRWQTLPSVWLLSSYWHHLMPTPNLHITKQKYTLISLLETNDASEVESSLCCSNIYMTQPKHSQNSKPFAGLKSNRCQPPRLCSCFLLILSVFFVWTPNPPFFLQSERNSRVCMEAWKACPFWTISTSLWVYHFLRNLIISNKE